MKKFLSLWLAFVMLISIFAIVPIGANAATTYVSGDFVYKLLTNKTAELTCYYGNTADLKIPSTLDGYNVTSIADNVFQGCDFLISIEIPNSVTNIGNSLFLGCDNLERVKLPDNISKINYMMFANCFKLNNIEIPKTVTSIEFKAFSFCESLTNITIPESVELIDEKAFNLCNSLENITILNPNCEIYQANTTVSSTATITGYYKSTARDFANKYSREFVSIDTPAEIDPTESEGLFVQVDDNLYKVEKGKKYTYTYSLALNDTISTLQLETKYDYPGITFCPRKTVDGNTNYSEMFPFFENEISLGDGINGEIINTYYSNEGIKFNGNTIILIFDFIINSDSGTYSINTEIDFLSNNKNYDYVFAGEIKHNFEVSKKFEEKHTLFWNHTDLMGEGAYDLRCSSCDEFFGRGYLEADGMYYLYAYVGDDGFYHYIYDENAELIDTEKCKLAYWDSDDDYHTAVCKCHLMLLSEEPHVNICKYDSEGHWTECKTCGYLSEIEEHFYDNESDTTCNDCEFTREVIKPETYSIYCVNSAGWENISVFAYTNIYEDGIRVRQEYEELYPGVSMKMLDVKAPDGSDVYVATFSREYEYLVFTVDEVVCTDDQKFKAGYYYENNFDLWYESLDEIPTVLLGDVDGDRKVTILDATSIQRHLAKLTDIEEDRIVCADTDKDGKISILDATQIQRFLAKLIPEL